MVEIAKALSLNARLVILDEPTSSLPIAETEKLLKVIAALKANGIAVMFVSHRLNEVVEACDRVIVLRDGRIVGHLEGDAMTHDAMVKLMVGRDLKVAYAAPASERGDVVLSVQKLRTTTFPFAEVSIDFHSGEILGLAGLVGAGRTELAHALFGIDATEGGAMLLDGAPVRFASSADAVESRRLPGARGSQGNGPAGRLRNRRKHHASQPQRLCARPDDLPRGRARAGRKEPR